MGWVGAGLDAGGGFDLCSWFLSLIMVFLSLWVEFLPRKLSAFDRLFASDNEKEPKTGISPNV